MKRLPLLCLVFLLLLLFEVAANAHGGWRNRYRAQRLYRPTLIITPHAGGMICPPPRVRVAIPRYYHRHYRGRW